MFLSADIFYIIRRKKCDEFTLNELHFKNLAL